MMRIRAVGTLLIAAGIATGCSSLDAINPFASKGPKPTELKPIKATATTRVLWREKVGTGELYTFTPAVVGNSVYAASSEGNLLRIDEGKVVWSVKTNQKLSAGVGTDGVLVAVGSLKGEVLVYSAADGKLAWKAQASSEILAPPAIGSGTVVVRSADNRITAYDASDGKRKWIFQRQQPSLALRTSAAPLIDGRYVVAGLPGGKLVAIALANGLAVWEGSVAQPKGTTELERVADITSVPVISNGTICAVAYQGRVACFDMNNGNLIWAREMSSSAGLTIDSRQLYVSDEKGGVHALDLASGASLWKQDALLNRRVTAPRVVRGYVAVADIDGVVHFLSRDDGGFVARQSTDGSPVVAPPQLSGSRLMIQTNKGGVFAIEAE